MISHDKLLEQLKWRYAVKKFDPDKKIEAATWAALEQSLVLTPSSYGLQPWKFVVISDQAIKDQLPAISWKQSQPKDCSHMVVMAARRQTDPDFIARNMQEIVNQRGLADDAMNGYRDILLKTCAQIENHLAWNSLQIYIALGQLMASAAMLGVDTCPMEGIVPAEYDKLLKLTESGYTTVVGCACGYRHAEDKQAAAAKVRFTADDVILHV